MQPRAKEDANGMDISQWQPVVQWGKPSVVFSYIRATDGTGIVDSKFASHWDGAYAHGVIPGAYHYFRPRQNIGEQADQFIKIAGAKGAFIEGCLPPALDVEVNHLLNSHTMTTRVLSWLTYVEHKTGRKPIIYLSPGFAKSHLQADKLSGYSLWLADWGITKPSDLSQWQRWTFWQYTDKGSVNGMSGNVDLDMFSGNRTALEKMIGGKTPMLKKGDTGDKVKQLQQDLVDLGYDLGKTGPKKNGVDGDYGPITASAVRKFEIAQGIQVDGIAGPQVMSHLKSALAAKGKKSNITDINKELDDVIKSAQDIINKAKEAKKIS